MKKRKILGILLMAMVLSGIVVDAATIQNKVQESSSYSSLLTLPNTGKTVQVTANLNMRSSASTAGRIILTIPKGKSAEYISTSSNGWYQVRYDGKTGFISNQYSKVIESVEQIPNTSQAVRYVTATSNLNVRSGTSTSTKILATIPKGGTAEYLGTASNGWYKVKYNGKTGYVSNKYSKLGEVAEAPVDKPTTSPTPPAVSNPAPAPESTTSSAQQVTLYYTTANANMRDGAGTNFVTLITIPKGAHLVSEGTTAGWHKVSWNGKTGWVSGQNLGSGTVTMKDGIIIANKGHKLSSNFAPGENPDARYKLNQFLSAGNSAGHKMNAYSGFRSYSRQEYLYNKYVGQDGKAAADRYSARPGYSEHQTGLAFDIGVGGMTTSTAIGTHPGGIWMAKNAHRFGFILSYPAGKESVTGYQYEPWHFRYVGVDMATKIYNSGKTLDEYLGTVSPNY